MTTARLLFKTHRFESVSVLLAALLIAALALVVAYRLSTTVLEPGCIEAWMGPGDVPITEECHRQWQEHGQINHGEAANVMAAMGVLPFAAGLLLGIPLVGGEIEHRTAALVWSLHVSRRRWLLKRALIVAGLLATVLAAPAAAAEILEPHRWPWYEPETLTFYDYGLRGPLTIFRGLAALSIGVLAGVVVGRVLPALIVGFVGVLFLVHVLLSAQHALLPEPEWVPYDDARASDEGYTAGRLVRAGLQFGDVEYRDGDGRVVSWQEIVARSPYPEYVEEWEEPNPLFYDWLETEYDQYTRFLPGDRLGIVVVREAAGLSVLWVVLLGGSLAVVSRRRPY